MITEKTDDLEAEKQIHSALMALIAELYPDSQYRVETLRDSSSGSLRIKVSIVCSGFEEVEITKRQNIVWDFMKKALPIDLQMKIPYINVCGINDWVEPLRETFHS